MSFATSTSYPSCSLEAPTDPKGQKILVAIFTTPSDNILDKSPAFAKLIGPIMIVRAVRKLNIFFIGLPFCFIEGN